MALALLAASVAPARAQDSAVIYVEQPTGIALADYAATWPNLVPYLDRLGRGARDRTTGELERLATAPGVSDGILNLLAQLAREDGRLDDADDFITRAIAARRTEHRHYFQQGMIFFARLTQASGLGRWTWQQRTRDAYQKAFDLAPEPVPYRYYLVYTLAQAPAIAGGDKNRALRMTQDGIDRGQKEFYVVRADVHRLRGEPEAALADYDRAMEARTFKLNSFLAAGALAMEKGDWERARRYFDWAVYCRPDSPRPHEGLGDYFLARGDSGAAGAAYEAAVRADPQSVSARAKLASLGGVR
jgi:tetratricopeptide (TPR) repeat protein